MKFYNANDAIYFVKEHDNNVLEVIPGGLYKIVVTMDGAWFSKEIVPEAPKLLFGNVVEQATSILDRFDKLGRQMGVWLNGLKGSGKTLQSQEIIRQAIKRGLPVFYIDQSFKGNQLIDILGKLNQPFMIFIDEFEKVYGTGLNDGTNSSEMISGEQQKSLLSLLDGVMRQPILTLITTNDPEQVSDFIRGRAGRIRYRYEYTYLSPSVIEEVCKSMIDNISQELINKIKVYSNWSIDSLKVLLEELKDFPGESIDSILKNLNIEFELKKFHWNLVHNGVDYSIIKTVWGSNKELTISAILNMHTFKSLETENPIKGLKSSKKDGANFVFNDVLGLFEPEIKPSISSDPLVITYETKKGKFEFWGVEIESIYNEKYKYLLG